ncbi:MAG: class I SAM-dependent methyltransferase [Bacteriovoracaceae bacterium]
MQYKKSIYDVRVGAQALKIETFTDLDQTIDELCASLPEGSSSDPLSEDLCPYFGVVWPAALGLGKKLQRIKDELVGKEILEIGCGLAIPSFIVTKLGGHITASDFHFDVEPFLKINQSLNDLHFPYLRMNWREPIQATSKRYDYVIGSDILYESRHANEVAEALLKFVKPGGKIILADPGRSYLQNFVSAMNSLGYTELLESISVVDKDQNRDIYLLSFIVTKNAN